MSFFKKLFEKKVCDLCGGEIGLLGNRKLEDGNCCKECAGKLSYWFDERRHSTVEQIRQQLAYREQNRQQLEKFRPVKSHGEEYVLRVQLNNGVPEAFVVERTGDYLEENADLLRFSQVTSFNIDIEEDEQELKRKNSEGEEVSYVPPRYQYSYDFYAQIRTDCPYCDELRFRLNEETLNLETVRSQSRSVIYKSREFDPALYPEYRQYKALCDELEELFQAGMQGTALPGYAAAPAPAAQAPAEAPAAPAAEAPRPKFCPNCGAPADGGKFCQSCGSQL